MNPAPTRCIACGDRPVRLFTRDAFAIVRSPGCGLQWRDPFPDERELRALYGDDYLERWGARDDVSLARVGAMKRRSHGRMLERAVLRGPGRLLDVGCAAGFLLDVAADRGFDAYGLDLNERAVALARRRHDGRVRCGTLDASAFPGLEFDVITLVDVFEHVTDPAGLLAAARSRLAPEGLLAVLLPNADSLVRRVLGARWPHYAAEHVFHWTPRSLELFLTRQGWSLRALRTGFRKHFTASYLVAYAARVRSWLPPGLSLLGDLGFSAPTGEMLVTAAPRPSGSALPAPGEPRDPR